MLQLKASSSTTYQLALSTQENRKTKAVSARSTCTFVKVNWSDSASVFSIIIAFLTIISHWLAAFIVDYTCMFKKTQPHSKVLSTASFCRWEKYPGCVTTWPPRIWAVKKSGGWEGWQSICCSQLFEFQNLEQSLKTTRSIGIPSRILPMKNATIFRFEFRSQRNSAAKWSTNVSTNSTRKRHVPNRSGSVSWMFVFGGTCNWCSSLCGIFDKKVFLSHGQLAELTYIYSFVHISLHQVYISLYLGRCLKTVPWHSQELNFEKWLFVLCSEREVYSGNVLWNSVAVLLLSYSTVWNWNQSDSNIFRLSCMKLRMDLRITKVYFPMCGLI